MCVCVILDWVIVAEKLEVWGKVWQHISGNGKWAGLMGMINAEHSRGDK